MAPPLLFGPLPFGPGIKSPDTQENTRVVELRATEIYAEVWASGDELTATELYAEVWVNNPVFLYASFQEPLFIPGAGPGLLGGARFLPTYGTTTIPPIKNIDGSSTVDPFTQTATLAVSLNINGDSTVADFTYTDANLSIKGIKTYKQEGYVVLSQRLTRLQSLIGFATFSQNQNSLRTLVGYAVLSPLQNVTLALKTDMAELYFAHEFLDFTNPANRAKFHDTNGKPVDLGTTGSLPTGSPPLLYLSLHDADNSPYLFASNESGAGSLTVETRDSNGVGFGFASTNPSD